MNDKENMCCPVSGSSRMQIGEISTETVIMVETPGFPFVQIRQMYQICCG